MLSGTSCDWVTTRIREGREEFFVFVTRIRNFVWSAARKVSRDLGSVIAAVFASKEVKVAQICCPQTTEAIFRSRFTIQVINVSCFKSDYSIGNCNSRIT